METARVKARGYHSGSADNYPNQEMYARCHVTSVTSSGKNLSGDHSPRGMSVFPASVQRVVLEELTLS